MVLEKSLVAPLFQWGGPEGTGLGPLLGAAFGKKIDGGSLSCEKAVAFNFFGGSGWSINLREDVHG
jgi:hypothetical protein